MQSPRQQREYYDGRKGYHCVNYLFIHDGNGCAIYIHGGVPGRHNDIYLLHNSSFYQSQHYHVSTNSNHFILADGAWRHEGLPFLCGFTDRHTFTAYEMVFNYLLAERRVLAENFYGRMHALWPIINYWTHRIDKLDPKVRALAWFTNVHLKYQSPLRHD